MFKLESVIQLKDDENVKAMVRRHLSTLVPQLALAMVLIVLPFFFLFPLFSLGPVGVILFGVCVAAGLVVAARSMFLWDADVLILTDERAIDVDQKGILSRRVSEAPFTVVQDVSWKREGFWQTFFRMGTLTIQTAGATAPISADSIGRPEKVYELVNDLRHEAKTNAPGQNANAPDKDRRTRMRHIADMLDKAEDTEVAEIERLLEVKEKEKSAAAIFADSKKSED